MEKWRSVIGFEGLYEVSDMGRVRRVGVQNCLRPSATYGYLHVMLTNGAIRKQPRIHVLVCETFIGPRPSPRHQACHGDGNRSNNALSNLRWATVEENAADKRAHGTHLCGHDVAGAVLHEACIQPIRDLIRSHVPLAVIAQAFRCTPENLAHIRDGKTWAHIPDPAVAAHRLDEAA